jgi:adhesin transport system membrane fusion protein
MIEEKDLRKPDKKARKRNRKLYDRRDVDFMNSLNGAVLQKSPIKGYLILYIIAILIGAFIFWANYAQVDELTRGVGRVIPSKQVQIVQNLEGGIIKQLLVAEGDRVKRGQVLLHIDDTGAGSTFEESKSRVNELKAKAVRLRAEAGISKFTWDKGANKEFVNLVKEEKRLYDTNQRRRQSEKDILKQRLRQVQIELSDARLNIKKLNESKKLIKREMDLTKPLFKRGLVSELEYIQLEQKVLDNQKELETVQKSIESIKSKISEARSQIKELEANYQSEAQEELNTVLAEIDRLSSTQVAIEDRVKRTLVRSPVDGTVKQLLVNTVGGVVKPGMDILEIVPDDDKLIVEAKIKPSDIAFIYPGLKAIVKFTAYDFAIYGGLEGTVIHISADTITDERQESFYLVRIKTDKNYLGTEDNKKNIIVGMTAQADIVTGKKSVMQYLMKPILRAKYNALRER